MCTSLYSYPFSVITIVCFFSNLFKINAPKYVSWGPQNGPFYEGDKASFSLKWKGASSKSGFFILREKVPSMMEILFPGFFDKSIVLQPNKNSTVSYTVNTKDVQFPWNVIPVFKYDCSFTILNVGYFCTEEVGPEFRIVSVNELTSWNYNSSSSAAVGPVQLFQMDCNSCLGAVCEMCKYGNFDIYWALVYAMCSEC